MEVCGSNVVEMPIEGEEASSGFVVPHLDFVVITTTDEQGLCRVEVYASNGAFMFLQAVIYRAHLVVPQLNTAIVKSRCQERQPGVEGDAFDPIRLGLKLIEKESKGAVVRQRCSNVATASELDLPLLASASWRMSVYT